MRYFGKVLVLFLAGVSFAGEGSARLEDIVRAMLGAIERFTTTLGTIQDEDSAKAAQPILAKGAAEWLSLRKKAENVAPPTREEKEKLEKEFKGKLEEAQKKLFAEIARVQTVAGGNEALQELSKAMARKPK